MKYKGNKSSLYVEEEKLKNQAPLFLKLMAAFAIVCAIIAMGKLAFGDALPHVEFQNMQRWLMPEQCDERCCDEVVPTQSVEKEEYATIVIDRRTANEIGGMDSTLPGMKVSKNAFLSARIIDNGNLEILVFVRGLNCNNCWEVYYASELIMP